MPETFKGNGNLKTLILDRYRTAIPKAIYKIASLERLGLSTMFDTLDLGELSKLKKLESLSLTYQQKFIGKLALPHLEHLSITSYRGTDLRIGISQLPALKSLVIWDCDEIETLSDFSAPSLISITINSNEKLKEINFSERELTAIQEITVRHNKSLNVTKETVNNVPIMR